VFYDEKGDLMSETFGFEFHPELYYLKDHVWVKVESDGTVKVGFDDIVAKASHEIFFMKILSEGTDVVQNKKIGVIESRKYTGPIACPVSGTIIAVNEEIRKIGPQVFMEDPYVAGWLCAIKPLNLDVELKNLLHGDIALEWFKKEAEPLVDELADFNLKHKH
jgi:glycine cleavage system H protein